MGSYTSRWGCENATGGRLIIEDPGHLYDFDSQRLIQLEVTGGRTLVTLGINGILPFLAILLIVLAVITYVPVLTLWLPGAILGP